MFSPAQRAALPQLSWHDLGRGCCCPALGLAGSCRGQWKFSVSSNWFLLGVCRAWSFKPPAICDRAGAGFGLSG